jgi:hypothetical protein
MAFARVSAAPAHAPRADLSTITSPRLRDRLTSRMLRPAVLTSPTARAIIDAFVQLLPRGLQKQIGTFLLQLFAAFTSAHLLPELRAAGPICVLHVRLVCEAGALRVADVFGADELLLMLLHLPELLTYVDGRTTLFRREAPPPGHSSTRAAADGAPPQSTGIPTQAVAVADAERSARQRALVRAISKALQEYLDDRYTEFFVDHRTRTVQAVAASLGIALAEGHAAASVTRPSARSAAPPSAAVAPPNVMDDAESIADFLIRLRSTATAALNTTSAAAHVRRLPMKAATPGAVSRELTAQPPTGPPPAKSRAAARPAPAARMPFSKPRSMRRRRDDTSEEDDDASSTSSDASSNDSSSTRSSASEILVAYLAQQTREATAGSPLRWKPSDDGEAQCAEAEACGRLPVVHRRFGRRHPRRTLHPCRTCDTRVHPGCARQWGGHCPRCAPPPSVPGALLLAYLRHHPITLAAAARGNNLSVQHTDNSHRSVSLHARGS